MRTVSFQSVYEGVLRRHGLDPLSYNADHDTARAIAANITSRVRRAWRLWDSPEFTRTEERAFLPSWSATRQYKRAGDDGKPDELYWPLDPSPGYYRVKSTALIDPPISTQPSNATYFETFAAEPVIDRDQIERNALGEVFGIYSGDPSLATDGAISIGLPFRPSERGVRVAGSYGATVFVWYRALPPKFSKIPWIEGKAYVPGDIVFYNTECYACLVATTSAPGTSDPSGSTNASWMLVPMPEILANHLVPAAYADCLRENVWTGLDLQTRMASISLAEAEAARLIEAEIDNLIAQGQKHYYGGNSWWKWTGNGMWVSQPWNGDKVTTLPLPVIPFTPPPLPSHGPPPHLPPYIPPPEPPGTTAGAIIYAPDIKSILGAIAPGLSTYDTVSLPVASMLIIYTGEQARIDAGPADPGDPGQIVPHDYNATTNDKHWVITE